MYSTCGLKLNSPDTSALLKDGYDKTFNYIDPKKYEEIVFSSDLARESSSVEDYCSLSSILEEYIGLGIKDSFGITVLEYLELTDVMRSAIVIKAKDNLEFKAKQAKDVKDELNGYTKKNQF